MYSVLVMTNEELLEEIAAPITTALPVFNKGEDFIAYVSERYACRTAKPNKKKKPLREEEFVGMWADREDMKDSVAWVRKTRETQWNKYR